MIKQLEEAKKRNQLLEIYRNLSDVGKFRIAKVLDANEEYTILSDISPDGLYDGFSLTLTERIFQINKNTRYIKNIEILYEAKNQSHFSLEVENKDFILGFFEVAKKQELVVIVEFLEEATIQGFVKSIEDDITCIACDNQEANCLKILYS
jgi:hypothetical protein